METGGYRRYYKCNLGGYLAGVQDIAEQKGHPVGYGSEDIGDRRAELWRCGGKDGQ